jgi:hypothetical protein
MGMEGGAQGMKGKDGGGEGRIRRMRKGGKRGIERDHGWRIGSNKVK